MLTLSQSDVHTSTLLVGVQFQLCQLMSRSRVTRDVTELT